VKDLCQGFPGKCIRKNTDTFNSYANMWL
jgi:hypothetical protein